MSQLLSAVRRSGSNRPRRAGLVAAVFLALAVIGSAGASSGALSAGISAHLTKKSFTSSQAGSVKLVYKFSATSSSFAYTLKLKQGQEWKTVNRVEESGTFSGSHSVTVKRLFGGKSIKVGSYQLHLAAGSGGKLLSFRVVKGSTASTAGKLATAKPKNTAIPVISGTVRQGETLTASRGSWNNSPSSFAYQWSLCDPAGANCSPISGATAKTYVPTAGDVGQTLRAIVAASNAKGSASATSDQTTAVTTFVASVSVGGAHGCALLADGKVKCWGYNALGAVGSGTASTTPVTTPTGVSGITNATQLSSGGYHSCALLADGTIKCWGRGVEGQLGDGAAANSATPVTVSGISNATQVAAGGYHSCAVLSDKTVKCWGWNFSGQIGNGSATNANTPVVVGGLANVVQIEAGANDTCAVLSDGTVRCWGYNAFGQVGDGTLVDRSTPTAVLGITTAKQVTVGDFHACAVLADSTMKCWGYNFSGAVGDGTTVNRATPVAVNGISTATQADAGDHTCAVLSSGVLACWGANSSGQLGNGTSSTAASPTPAQVPGLSNVSQVSANSSETCVLLVDGTVDCWGSNGNGQLGDGTTTEKHSPGAVTGLP